MTDANSVYFNVELAALESVIENVYLIFQKNQVPILSHVTIIEH